MPWSSSRPDSTARTKKETLLTWQESELTGMEGTKTSLCVQPRSVVLSREGTLNTRMEFEEGRKRYFLYETPFGSATMGLNTRRIVNRLGAHGGEIEIDYSVDMDETHRRPQPVFHPRAGAASEPYQRCHLPQLSDSYEASLVQREVANPKGLTEGLPFSEDCNPPVSPSASQPPLHKGAFSFLQMQHVDAERRGEEPREIGAQRRGDGVARFAHARRAKVDGENVKRRLR